MIITRLSPVEWFHYAQDAHLIVFNEVRPAEFNRIDFALTTLVDGVPMTYATCRELDEETVYLQYGGSFPSAKGTTRSYQAYYMTIKELSKTFKRVTTLIENENLPMLKFAMKVGLRIIGIRFFQGKIYLEHAMEFGGELE